jgi:hypothetical protein
VTVETISLAHLNVSVYLEIIWEQQKETFFIVNANNLLPYSAVFFSFMSLQMHLFRLQEFKTPSNKILMLYFKLDREIIPPIKKFTVYKQLSMGNVKLYCSFLQTGWK